MNKDIIITTTPTIEGKKIIKYIGPIISTESGTSLFQSKGDVNLLYKRALNKLYTLAKTADANAVVGMSIGTEIDRAGVVVTVVGTAVVYENE